MNEYDSERVAGLLREHRWELTSDETEADLILVNTCAIREKAEDKVFSKLGELRLLKTRRPDLVIGVMGCMAQLHQRSEEHTSELQSLAYLVCRLLLEKKKKYPKCETYTHTITL